MKQSIFFILISIFLYLPVYSQDSKLKDYKINIGILPYESSMGYIDINYQILSRLRIGFGFMYGRKSSYGFGNQWSKVTYLYSDFSDYRDHYIDNRQFIKLQYFPFDENFYFATYLGRSNKITTEFQGLKTYLDFDGTLHSVYAYGSIESNPQFFKGISFGYNFKAQENAKLGFEFGYLDRNQVKYSSSTFSQYFELTKRDPTESPIEKYIIYNYITQQGFTNGFNYLFVMLQAELALNFNQ